MIQLNCSSILTCCNLLPHSFPSQCKNGVVWFFMRPIFDSKGNIWTTTHLFSLFEVIERTVWSQSLNSEYLLEVYPRSFPHLSWPLVLRTFFSSSLYWQLPLWLFTIFFFLKSCLYFSFFSSLFDCPLLLLVSYLLFHLQDDLSTSNFFGEDLQDPVLALTLSSLHLVSGYPNLQIRVEL